MITAESSVQLLTFMSKHRYANVFRDALPIAGVDGTLRNRMRARGGKQRSCEDWFVEFGSKFGWLRDNSSRGEVGVCDHGQQLPERF